MSRIGPFLLVLGLVAIADGDKGAVKMALGKIGGRGARCIHHDRFSVAQPCIRWIVELAIYCIPKQLTDTSRGTVMCAATRDAMRRDPSSK